MKKIILFLSIFIFSLNISYWDDSEPVVEKTEIKSILYDGNINTSTEIRLTGTKLWTCTHFIYNDQTIYFKTVSETSLNFPFSKLNSYNWTFYVICSNIKLWQTYSFPIIESLDYTSDNTNRSIIIKWKNLNWWKVTLDNWTFTIDSQNPTSILWTISENFNKTTLYVTVWNLKSNLFDSKIKIPKINFIQSDGWFSDWSYISIYWENLSAYWKTKIYLWDKKIITDFEILNNWNTLKFKADNIIWTYDLKVYSNWFLSDPLKISIYWKRPNITSVIEKYDSEIWDLLYIYWKNFPSINSEFKAIINWVKYDILSSDDELIKVKWYILESWSNQISVLSSWNYSNSINYLNLRTKLPIITSITVWNIEKWVRNILVNLSNYNSADFIYIDNVQTKPVTCTWWVCRFELRPEVIKWNFRVGRWKYISPNYIWFNLTEKYQPFIEEIKFPSWIVSWAPFEIKWKNFYEATISWTNFFKKKDTWSLDIEISDWSIKWKLDNDVNLNSTSSISINKYWLSYSFSFSLKDSKDIIYASPFVYWYKSNDIISKVWSKIILNWQWFKEWDIVLLWTYKTKLNILDNSFILPQWLNKWLVSAYIQNLDWNNSNSFNIYVSSINDTINSKINVNELTNNTFYVDSISTNDIVYSFDFDNIIDNLVINNITFDVKSDLNTNDLGLYSLYYGSTLLWINQIDKLWKLKFDYSFEIPLNSIGNKFILYKFNPYSKSGNFDIKLSNIEWKYKNYTDLVFSWIYPTLSVKNFINSQMGVSCIDIQTSNINCNSFLQWIYIPLNTTQTINNNTNQDNLQNNTVNNTIQTNQESNTTQNTPVKNTDYSLLITKTKTQVVKNLIINRTDLNKTSSWKKYSNQLDTLLPKITDSKKYQLLQKIYNMKKTISSNNSSKYIEIKKLLNFMESRLELELLN